MSDDTQNGLLGSHRLIALLSFFAAFAYIDLDEHVDDWFGGYSRDGSARKVLDASKKLVRETRTEMSRSSSKSSDQRGS